MGTLPKSAGRGEVTTLMEELATWQAASGCFSPAGFPLPNPDPILWATGQAQSVYRSMLYDAHVGGLARRRRAAVKALAHQLEAGKAKAKTLKLVEAALSRLDVPEMVGCLWEAALFGYACAEVLWQVDGGLLLPVAVLPKPQEWFRFDVDGRLLFMAVGAANGVPVPERKFLLARQDATATNPYGMADLARCFWPWTFKRGGFKFWLQFVEKYGTPKLVGKFDRNTTEREQDDLLAVLTACVQDAVMVIPNDNTVEMLDSKQTSGAAENYEGFLRACRAEISIALLGQDQTTEADANRASAVAGLEVTRDIRDADAGMVQRAVQELVDWIVELNLGAGAEPPAFVLYEPTDAAAEAEADTRQAARDLAVAQLRPHFSDEYLQKTYRLPAGALREREEPVPEHQPEAVAAQDTALSQPQPAFAEPTRLDAEYARALKTYLPLDALTADFSPVLEAMLAPVIDRLTQGNDVSEQALADAVAAVYPDMDASDAAELLARARFVCRLWGYCNV